MTAQLVVEALPRAGYLLGPPGSRSGRALPKWTSSTSQVCSVWPVGDGEVGEAGGATRWEVEGARGGRSRQHVRSRRATGRTVVVARLRPQAGPMADGGSQPCSSSSGRRARTVARAVASGKRAGEA